MIKDVLQSLIEGHTLSEETAEAVMHELMNGEAEESQIGSLLTLLRYRGETVAELTGFVRAMRAHTTPVPRPSHRTLLDTCGTGGDQLSTFNISTAAAIGVSACGIAVAKHGNRFVSSNSGSADVLEQLNLPIDKNPADLDTTIAEQGLFFLFAPVYNSAMKHVAKARKALGFRSIFNLLGPLTNPARADVQVVGVFDRNYGKMMAEVLRRLGTKRALFVTGEEGIDEMTITGKTYVTELDGDRISSYTIEPEMFGIQRGSLPDIQATSVAESATMIHNIFYNHASESAKQVFLLNIAAGLYVSDEEKSWTDAYERAYHALKDGTILAHFQQLQRKAGKIHA
ncbi:anthranilate phosphoribosyltransferase [Natribacillus halophilus]|uniref:Anthranilate phosphoribosyltransferase n=1 Tax=Natribacillus halophilus TaxID=549003 RepID=A0A1G8JCG8_9BACI|nr:anthranilate phosphoribosyltransferase [Natribacillus halophilus]SDI28687.1 anthranilate phosphoribosyltransferase [Natribacillus halophilus]